MRTLFRFPCRLIVPVVCLTTVATFVVPTQADEPAHAESRIADAAESEEWTKLSILMAAGDDVNMSHPDGMAAIHWAVHHGHAETIRRLIDAKCNVNAETRYHVTPLSIACTLDNSQSVDQLLDAGANVHVKLPGGETPLMIAARTGNVDSIRHLIQHEADLDATDRNGQTAFMWAAAAGNADAVEVLASAGADVNVSLQSGFTAMMFAAREGHMAVVSRLLDAGVDLNDVMKPQGSGNRVPRQGTSALTLAVESGHFELAVYLIESGADPNDQRSGFSPLHAISWVRKPNRGEEPDGDPPPRGSGNLTSLQFVRAIVAAGADVNLSLEKGKGGKAVLNPQGATPMLMAARTADIELLRLLLELGADPMQTNVDGCTPLMAAAGVGVRAVGEEAGTEPEVIDALQFLLDQGLDVNVVDANNETAMHGAAYRNFPLVVEFLASHGADPKAWNHKNVAGWTPTMIAEGHRPGSFKPSPVTVRALETAMSVESE